MSKPRQSRRSPRIQIGSGSMTRASAMLIKVTCVSHREFNSRSERNLRAFYDSRRMKFINANRLPDCPFHPSLARQMLNGLQG
jgi:hypothetical protein